MEIVSVCTSIPIYFVLSIKRALLSGEVRAEHSKPTPVGAPFYTASSYRIGAARFPATICRGVDEIVPPRLIPLGIIRACHTSRPRQENPYNRIGLRLSSNQSYPLTF